MYESINQQWFSADQGGQRERAGTGHSAQHAEKRVTPEGTEKKEFPSAQVSPSRLKMDSSCRLLFFKQSYIPEEAATVAILEELGFYFWC